MVQKAKNTDSIPTSCCFLDYLNDWNILIHRKGICRFLAGLELTSPGWPKMCLSREWCTQGEPRLPLSQTRKPSFGCDWIHSLLFWIWTFHNPGTILQLCPSISRKKLEVLFFSVVDIGCLKLWDCPLKYAKWRTILWCLRRASS